MFYDGVCYETFLFLLCITLFSMELVDLLIMSNKGILYQYLHFHCLVLVCFRNGFELDFTIELT